MSSKIRRLRERNRTPRDELVTAELIAYYGRQPVAILTGIHLFGMTMTWACVDIADRWRRLLNRRDGHQLHGMDELEAELRSCTQTELFALFAPRLQRPFDTRAARSTEESSRTAHRDPMIEAADGTGGLQFWHNPSRAAVSFKNT